MNNLKLYTARKLVRVKGTNAKGDYDMVATLGVDAEGKVHDVTFDLNDWDAIAAEGVRERDEVYVEGELRQHTDPAKRYIVNKGTPNAYERLVMGHAQPVSFKPRQAFRGKPYAYAKDLPLQTQDSKTPADTQPIPLA